MAAREPIHRGHPKPHVPAWKKLGLKLKFAKELPEHSSLRSDYLDETNGQRRKRSISDPPANHETSKKKRVSFDASAKENDGSSAKDLMKAWDAREDELWTNNFIIPETALPKKAKRKKAPKASARLVVNTDSPSVHSTVHYLQQYYSSRKDWKFSKNKETWLQKHILSLDHIPSSYDPALRSYIRGLQSQATRSRIRASAEEAIKNDKEEESQGQDDTTESEEHDGKMEDTGTRQKYYESALARYKKQLEDAIDREDEEEEQEKLNEKWQSRIDKRKRAEMVVWDLDSSEQAESSSNPSNGFKRVKIDGGEESLPTKKKRKNRTNVVEVSSSADNDTSSSGSDSGFACRQKRWHGRPGSTSKSSSTSSSDPDSSSSISNSESSSSEDFSEDDDSQHNDPSLRTNSQLGDEDESTSESESSDDESPEPRRDPPEITRFHY